MKKFFMFMIVVLLFSGCTAQPEDDGVVDVWYYLKDSDRTQTIESAVSLMESYARKNNIEFVVTGFKSSDISYDDYVLKRNIAIENKEADIVLDDIQNLYGLKNVSGDYTRIKGYDDLFDGLKGRDYLPLTIRCFATAINGDLFDEYNLEYKKIMSYPEYYELKRKLRSAGAMFDINMVEVKEILDSYVNEWSACIELKNDGYVVDAGKMQVLLTNVYDNLKLPDGSYADIIASMNDGELVIRDEKTGIMLRDYDWAYGMCLDYRYVLEIGFGADMPDNDVYLLRNLNDTACNGFLITNKASDQAYDVASILFSDKYFRNCDMCASTVNTDWARRSKEADENWQYQGELKDNLSGRSGSLSKEIFDAGYQKVLNGEFDLIYEDSKLKQYFRSFIVDRVAEMRGNGGKITGLDEKIKDFEININMR